MRRAAHGASPDRRRIAVARVSLVLGLCAGLAAVLPTASGEEALRLDATATTIPSDRPAPGADEPLTPSSTSTPLPELTPEQTALIEEVLADLQEIAAASEPEPAAYADSPLQEAVAEAIEEAVATDPPAADSPLAPPPPGATVEPSPTVPSSTSTTTVTTAPGGQPTGTTQPGATTTTTKPAGSTTTTKPSGSTTTTTRPPTTTTTTRPPTTTTTRPRPAVPPGDPQPCSTPGMLEHLVDPTNTYFVWDGQSNTNMPDGGNRPTSYPGLVMRDLFPAPVPWGDGWINLAVNGSTQAYRTHERTGERDPGHYADLRSKQVLFNEGGATDFEHGATAQEMLDDTREYVAKQRAAGYDVIVQAPTLPNARYGAAQEHERKTFHDRLCREYRSLGIDGLVDPTTLPQLTANVGEGPYWADDRVHLTAEGVRLVADEYLRTLRHAG